MHGKRRDKMNSSRDAPVAMRTRRDQKKSKYIFVVQRRSCLLDQNVLPLRESSSPTTSAQIFSNISIAHLDAPRLTSLFSCQFHLRMSALRRFNGRELIYSKEMERKSSSIMNKRTKKGKGRREKKSVQFVKRRTSIF